MNKPRAAHYNGQDVKVHLFFTKQIVTEYKWVNNEPAHKYEAASIALIELPDGTMQEVLATQVRMTDV